MHEHHHEHPFDKHRRHMEDGRTVLQYINRLYCIELLRYADWRHVDTNISYQYAVACQLPWAHSKEMVRKFALNNTEPLMAFINQKMLRVLDKVCKGVEDLKTNLYAQAPIDPAARVSIVQLLKELENDNYVQRIMDYSRWKIIKGIKNQYMRPVTGMFMPFELADRLLCGIFDTYTQGDESYGDPGMKHCLGPNRQELLDDPVYLCLCKLKKLCKDVCTEAICNDLSLHFGVMACMMSIPYHLYIPRHIHPNRMERLYDKYILHHPEIVPALQYARKWRYLSIEAVADDKLPVLDHEIKHIGQPVLEEGMALQVIYPNDLVEKYLTTQWLIEHTSCHE